MEWVKVEEDGSISEDSNGQISDQAWIAMSSGFSYGIEFKEKVFLGYWDTCEGYKTEDAIGEITHVARAEKPKYPK